MRGEIGAGIKAAPIRERHISQDIAVLDVVERALFSLRGKVTALGIEAAEQKFLHTPDRGMLRPAGQLEANRDFRGAAEI